MRKRRVSCASLVDWSANVPNGYVETILPMTPISCRSSKARFDGLLYRAGSDVCWLQILRYIYIYIYILYLKMTVCMYTYSHVLCDV